MSQSTNEIRDGGSSNSNPNPNSYWKLDEEQALVAQPTEISPLLNKDPSGKKKNAGPSTSRTEDGGGNDENCEDNGDDASSVAEEQTVIVEEVSTTRLALIMGTVWVGVFLGAMDATIIATLSASISSEFRSLSLLSWLAAAYLIANASFQPISGRLTDIFGRGPGLILSNLLFAAGNLICGLATNEHSMIAGRVVAGIGGGGLMSISTFLGSDLFPLRKRGVVQGIGNLCYGSGAMMGSVIGGLVNDHTALGWRLAFLMQVPPVLISAVLVARLVHVPPKQSDKSYLARVDFVGVFLIISFLVLLLLGLNAGGNLVPWSHPLVLASIPLSGAAFITFAIWEDRAKQPIIPVRLLLDRTIAAACITNLLCTMVVMMVFFYVPIYLQVLGNSATEAGLRILTSPLGSSAASLGSGYLMKRTGKYHILGIFSLVVHVAGCVLLTFLRDDTPKWVVSIMFLFLGSGYGAMLTITLLACVAAVDHSSQAVITSATYAFRSVGGTVGVTVASAIYQNVLKARLWERFGGLPGAAGEIARIRDDLDELSRLPEGWRDGVIQSFMDAFGAVWYTALGAKSNKVRGFSAGLLVDERYGDLTFRETQWRRPAASTARLVGETRADTFHVNKLSWSCLARRKDTIIGKQPLASVPSQILHSLAVAGGAYYTIQRTRGNFTVSSVFGFKSRLVDEPLPRAAMEPIKAGNSTTYIGLEKLVVDYINTKAPIYDFYTVLFTSSPLGPSGGSDRPTKIRLQILLLARNIESLTYLLTIFLGTFVSR
ncbi:major facilitator superfamily transporter [Zalerion maritima]|uniref:Major facilitator superfamily transporter n=1 Tax=Zalerion maritima TaxID=339359 RepID=A0AAD5RXV0_9PEZI|nr:major facilitator superfamily transporter [Zalerion maritima]